MTPRSTRGLAHVESGSECVSECLFQRASCFGHANKWHTRHAVRHALLHMSIRKYEARVGAAAGLGVLNVMVQKDVMVRVSDVMVRVLDVMVLESTCCRDRLYRDGLRRDGRGPPC